jgi:ubiquitin-conjugating enzyme E2 Z
MTNFITKDSIKRLLKDVKNIIQNPLTENGIYYIHDDTDLLKGYALIIGPEDTPYFGGYYFFELKYPFDYPHTPPKVTYRTNGDDIRFNPNLYKCGKVCISLLNTWRGEQWTSCQTISTVLLTLCTLLCKDPLLNEPGISKNHPDMQKYTDIIEYENINIAICNIINKKAEVYHSFFANFEPFIKDNFLKNYDKLLQFAVIKNTEFSNNPIIMTGAYNMKVLIDYKKVIEKLNTCKILLN